MPGEYSYMKNLLIGVDQLFNCVFNGYADESLSSRAYRSHRDNMVHWPYCLLNFLFFWQDDHCKQSYQSEVDRRQLPPEFRDQ